MAHNPPRAWMTDEHYRELARSMRNRRQRVDLDDLADKMLARAAAGKKVVLSPGTAEVVGRALKERRGRK